MSEHKDIIRYPDSELAEFKSLLTKKLESSQQQLDDLKAQIIETSEKTGDDYGGDWVDDSSNSSNIEMLNNMAIRQQKYIQELHNALRRVENKVYGICVITGDLIDKKRLLAVPTTTKSLVAKTDMHKKAEKRMRHRITDNPYVKQNQEKEQGRK